MSRRDERIDGRKALIVAALAGAVFAAVLVLGAGDAAKALTASWGLPRRAVPWLCGAVDGLFIGLTLWAARGRLNLRP